MGEHMEKRLLHTPEGVRDIYNVECRQKLFLQEELHRTIKEYGFQDIQTPTFEYFDVFGKEMGTISSKDLYKFFDREGNTLVLRPDYTPSIARCAAKYYMEEDMPLRFCYVGNVFINDSAAYQGRLKEATQMGAELIGDSTADADADMISLVVNLLLKAGIQNFQVEIGQVEFFKGLLQEADIPEETAVDLRELISKKNYFGLEELLSEQPISDELKKVFLKLPELFGSVEILEEAKQLTTNAHSLRAIERLQEIYDIIKIYQLERYITFDLGMLSKYQYYTGIIFRAFTLGMGEPIVKGGRYDNLLSLFGKEAPSIGFTLLLDSLMSALSRQGIDILTQDQNVLYLYEKDHREKAIPMAMLSRSQGSYTEIICRDENKTLEDYTAYCKKNGIKVVYYVGNGRQIKVTNVVTGEEKALTSIEN